LQQHSGNGGNGEQGAGGGLDSRRAGDWAIRLLCAACLLVLLLDGLLHLFHAKHGHFAAENWFGFYGVAGALSICGIVLGGRWLRRLVMRDEDYYERD